MRGRAVLRLLLALVLGAGLALLSTFVGERSARATYPDVMGCEVSCLVVATGWPLVFVRDYTGMSVVNSAAITEAIFAADRFDPLPFAVDVVAWAALCLLLHRLVRRISLWHKRGHKSPREEP